MTEQTYTAEQYETMADHLQNGTPNWRRESFGNWKDVTLIYDKAPKDAADMLRQAAQMMREREQKTFSLSKEFVSRTTNSCEEEPPVIGVGCIDSIKRIAEEMVYACKAERQGDAEFTHEVIDDWAHRIMCFADYVPRAIREPVTNAEVTDRVAKAIADAAGHGMREKCEHLAHAAISAYRLATWHGPEDAAQRVAHALAEKLSDRLWDILNEATLRNALTVEQLCTIDEARALAKRVEDAPVAPVSHTWAGADHTGQQWFLRETMLSGDYAGKRVRLVPEGE